MSNLVETAGGILAVGMVAGVAQNMMQPHKEHGCGCQACKHKNLKPPKAKKARQGKRAKKSKVTQESLNKGRR